jgi:membrane-associated protease RseP (regulator of RpoE activity)
MSATSVDPTSEVRARFAVKDSYQLPDGEMEYRVEYSASTKVEFEKLTKNLSPQGLTPWLTGTKDECVLTVRKTSVPEPRRSRVPVILALSTLASVVFFSLFERLTFERFAPSIPGTEVIGFYLGSVVLILGVHELARRYVASRSGTPNPRSYALPGVPYLTTILPSLGFVSAQTRPAVNRDRLFDIMVAGPLLALAVAAVIYLAGGFASVQSTQPLPSCESNSTFISVCSGALQSSLDAASRPFVPAVAPGYLRFSPLQDGASIGFLLTFINLLPMASFDGGYLSNLVWGTRAARVTTYLSALALILIDAPFYWGVGIVVLILAGRQIRPQVLDDVSGVSGSRRTIFFGSLVLALLCLPFPQNVATFTLG